MIMQAVSLTADGLAACYTGSQCGQPLAGAIAFIFPLLSGQTAAAGAQQLSLACQSCMPDLARSISAAYQQPALACEAALPLAVQELSGSTAAFACYALSNSSDSTGGCLVRAVTALETLGLLSASAL